MAKDKPIIDRSCVLAMINLLDWLYKRGVCDAEKADDEGLCREFLADTDNVGTFGFLTDTYHIDWREWILRLTMQAQKTSWNGMMSRYIARAGRYGQNYLGVFYPVALLWYRLGVEHYITDPHADSITRFCDKSKIWWLPQGHKNITTQEFVNMIQQQCFDLERKHTEVFDAQSIYTSNKLGAMRPRQFEFFRRAVGLALFEQ